MVYFVLLLDCAGAHVGEDAMKEYFPRIEESLKRLVDGAAGVRQVLSDTMCIGESGPHTFFSSTKRLLDEAERLDRLSLELDVRVSEAVYIVNGGLSIPWLLHVIC